MKKPLHKRIISTALITVFIVQSILLFTHTTRVYAAVPVVEIGPNLAQNTVTAKSTLSVATKEFALDKVGYAMAKTAINALTASIVNWINSGFQGGPAFVTDLRGFLLDVADAETAHFIEALGLANLCSPWKLNIRIALALPTSQFEREVACTLSDIVANMDAFINGDFSQGGWAGWFELTTKPQNNPYGLYLMTASELDRRIASTQQEQTQLLNWGRGFLSWTDCVPYGVDPDTGEEFCREEIVTPGVVIEKQLEKVLNTNLTQLELADEFDEIISALVGQLIQQAMGGFQGLRGASRNLNNRPSLTSILSSTQGGASLSSIKASGLVEIDQDMNGELNYRNVKQSTLNAVLASENLLLNLYACYAGKLAGSLNSADKIIAQQRMDNASSTIVAQIISTKISLENDIESSNQNLTTLGALKDDIIAATIADVIGISVNELISLRRSGTLNGSNIYTAQQEQSTITAQMSALNATTNTQITECQAFPPLIIQQQNP